MINKKQLLNIRFSLFWKILFSLWVIFFAVFITNLVIIQINSDDVRFRPIPPHYLEQLQFRKKKLKFILNGKTQIPPRAAKLMRNTYLIDSKGVDFLNREIPDVLSQLHHQVIYRKYSLLAFKKENHYVGGSEIRINQQNYRLYIHQKAPVLSQRYFGLLVREFTRKLFFITFIASFPFSFLVAWFFSRPIKKLRVASHDLMESLDNKIQLSSMVKRTDEFGDLAKDIDKLASHVNQLIKSKNRLLGDVSHELRSPLARQKIAIGLLKKSKTANRELIDRIELESNRLESMIASILDYARIEDVSNLQDDTEFDFSALLEQVIDDSRFEANSKNVEIRTVIPSSVNIIGRADLLSSGIENLLRNAIRYAESQVEIRLLCEVLQLQLIIKDDGKGVPEEELERVFEAFYRPQVDRSRDSGGVGLGLSIASKAVDLHGGSIHAERLKPKGFKVIIRLPIEG